MKLYEFFGSFQTKDHNDPRDKNEDGKISQDEQDKFKQDLYFYILDNDDIHKKQFYDVAETIQRDKKVGEDVWMPMVNKGCLDYYKEAQMREDPKDLFSKEFREDLCKMLDDHYRKDVIKGEYRYK